MRILLIALAMLLSIVGLGSARNYDYKEASTLFVRNQMYRLIKPVPIQFDVDTELEGIVVVYRYLQDRYEYMADDEHGYFTSSDEMFTKLKGDCEDWAMLFVAMLRFSISKPIPPDRIWAVASRTCRGTYHAWVLYQTPWRDFYSIDLRACTWHIKPNVWMEPVYQFNDKEALLLPRIWHREYDGNIRPTKRL